MRTPWLPLLACLGAGLPAQDRDEFPKLADEFVRRHALTKGAAALDLDRDVFAGRALGLRIGLIHLTLMHGDLAGRQGFLDLQQIALALCDLQRRFVEWTLGAAPPPALDAAARPLQAWIKAWKPPAEAGDLAPDAAATATADAFAGAVADALGLDATRCRAHVWLTPSRRAFVETGAFLGGLAPENRELLWKPYLHESAEAWASRPRVIQLVATEYAPPDGAGSDGVRMDAREKTGLLQHVVQRCAASLCVAVFGDGIDRDFEAGLSQNLVVSVLKENNARTGGSGRGAFAAARSVFVAGGASSGGTLAPIDLDSQWRATKGRDYFIKPLKQGQRAGAKAAGGHETKDRIGNFLLAGEGEARHAVAAPFLGPPIAGLPGVPAAVADDFKEMLRAYRSGFVHWLRESAGKGKPDSIAKFGALLRSMAGSDGRVTFELACRKVYGERLSDAGPTPPSLEWRYLQWLAR